MFRPDPTLRELQNNVERAQQALAASGLDRHLENFADLQSQYTSVVADAHKLYSSVAVQPLLEMQRLAAHAVEPFVGTQFLLTDAVQTLVDMQRRLERVVQPLVNAQQSYLQTVQPLLDTAAQFDVSKWTPLLDAGLIGTDFSTRQFDALFGGVLVDVERLRPLIEQYEVALRGAPDEPSRRLTLRVALRSIVEVAIGFDLQRGTPEERFKLYMKLTKLLVTLCFAYSASQTAATRSRETTQQEETQAQTIAELVEAVRELQHQLAERPAAPLLVITHSSILRAGPSADTSRTGRLSVGTMARLITLDGRWYYVEVVANDRDGADMRGWVYRRNVRFLPNEP